jgi:hypothetical protein
MRRLPLLLAAALLAAPALGLAQDKPTTPTVTPYGFVLLNAFFDSATFSAKDYPGAVTANNPDGGAILMSARQSRFGVRLAIDDGNWTGAKLSGVLEFDFKGGHIPSCTATACTAAASTAWYNGIMRLRLASMKADWKTSYGGWQILAGQDYGLVNPVFATSLAWVADPLFWQAGNLWQRGPQVRLSYLNTFDKVSLTLAAAAISPMDTPSAATDFGAGNRSRFPGLEARGAVGAKLDQEINGTLGVAYHMGKRTYLISGQKYDKDASLVGVDLDANLTQYFSLKGEWYTGTGVDDTYNGLGTGIVASTSATDVDAVDADGFWAQGIIKPIPEIHLTVGYGQGKAKERRGTPQALASTARYQNTQMAAGVIVNAGKFWKFGVEGIQVESKYGGSDTAHKASQVAVSSMFSF